jgi:hypothetical protein
MADNDNDLERLIKIMGQTTNDNDNQALVAVRTANRLADRLGGWSEILRGKVRVNIIADPFANMKVPTPQPSRYKPTAPPKPQPVDPDIDDFMRSRTTRQTPPPPPRTPHHAQTPTNRPFTPPPTQKPPRPDIKDIFGSAPDANVQNQRLRERPNAYLGSCVLCKNEVAPLDGTCYQRQSGGRWYTEHKKGQCPPPRKRHAAFTSDDLQL